MSVCMLTIMTMSWEGGRRMYKLQWTLCGAHKVATGQPGWVCDVMEATRQINQEGWCQFVFTPLLSIAQWIFLLLLTRNTGYCCCWWLYNTRISTQTQGHFRLSTRIIGRQQQQLPPFLSFSLSFFSLPLSTQMKAQGKTYRLPLYCPIVAFHPFIHWFWRVVINVNVCFSRLLLVLISACLGWFTWHAHSQAS